VLPDPVASRVSSYLALVDDALPGAVTGLYVHGSTALGSWMPGRSDIDLLAVVDGPFDVDALRRAHRRHHDRELARAVLGRRYPLQCNTTYVTWSDLARPATSATPLASHVARSFSVGGGFDANPVTWRILARSPVAVRGPTSVEVFDDDALLRSWTRQNLHDYWAGWARAARRGAWQTRLAWLSSAWAALGTARMHCTITTGAVISKEDAGAYALDTFDARWHPLVETALAYRRGELGTFTRAGATRLASADFVDMVIADVTC
jgi:hypothetical protein